MQRAELDAAIASGEDLIVVFHATWCRYCRSFLPRASVGATRPVRLYDVSDEADPAWDDFAIRRVPTAIRFRGGVEVARAVALPVVGMREGAYRAVLEA